jgi:hypothetical protein
MCRAPKACRGRVVCLLGIAMVLGFGRPLLAELVWVTPAWKSEIVAKPKDEKLAKGKIVDPKADRVQFKAFAETTSQDTDSTVSITFSRTFKLVGKTDTVALTTLDGLVYGSLAAELTTGEITQFSAEVKGSAEILGTAIKIIFPQSRVDVSFVDPSAKKEVSDPETDSGYLWCGFEYTVSGHFDVIAHGGFFASTGIATADFWNNKYVLEVGVKAGKCTPVPEPGTALASIAVASLAFGYRSTRHRARKRA